MNKQNIDRSALIDIKTVQLKPKKIEVITLDDDDEDEPKPSTSAQYTVGGKASVTQKAIHLRKTEKQRTTVNQQIMTQEQNINYQTLLKLIKKHPKNRYLKKTEMKIKRNTFRTEYTKRIFARSPKKQRIFFLELKAILEKMIKDGSEDDDVFAAWCRNNVNEKNEEIVDDPKEDFEDVEKHGTFPKKKRPPKKIREALINAARKQQAEQKKVAKTSKVQAPPPRPILPAPSILTTGTLNTPLPLIPAPQPLMNYPPVAPIRPLAFPSLGIPEPIKQQRIIPQPTITHLLQQISDSSRSASQSPTIPIYQQQQQQPYPLPQAPVGPGYNLLSERWWERPLPALNERVVAENFVRGIVDAGGMSVYEIQLKEQQERRNQAREEQALKRRLEEVERQIQELDRISGQDDRDGRNKKSSMEEEFERRELELRKREMALEAKEQELLRNNERLKMDRYGSYQHSNDGFNNSSSSSMPSPYSPINISMDEEKEMPQQQHRRHMKRRGHTSSSSSHRHQYEDISPEGSPPRRKRSIESSHHVRSSFYDNYDAISEDEEDQGRNKFVVTIPDKITSSGETKRRRYTPPKDVVYVDVSDDE